MSKSRIVLACLLAIMPGRLRRVLGKLVFNWEIHPTAHLGHSIVVADQVTLGPGASIGTGNVIKGLSELRLEEDATIRSFNWISSPAKSTGAFESSPARNPALIMKTAAAIANRHIIDCSDTVTFEDFALLAGVRSTIFTHGIKLAHSQQRTAPVTLGAHAAVMTNSLLISGTVVPPRSIVSAGSVVNTKLTKEHVVYGGNPAVEVRDLPANLAFFHRTSPKTG